MKKIKLLLVLVLGILLMPVVTNAKDSETPKKINVYFFRGEGCSHCAEAEEFFKSIEKEYGKYYKLVDYETWYNTDNQELMEKVAKTRGEKAEGVPYIIIGNQSWNGYSSDYDDAIKSKIKEEYEKSDADRYDIMNYVKSNKKDNNYASDIVSVIIIILVAGGIAGGIYYARRKTA